VLIITLPFDLENISSKVFPTVFSLFVMPSL